MNTRRHKHTTKLCGTALGAWNEVTKEGRSRTTDGVGCGNENL